MRWQQGPNRVLLVNDKLSICMTEESTHFPPISWNMGCLRQARATRWQFKAKWGPFGTLGLWMRSQKTGSYWSTLSYLTTFNSFPSKIKQLDSSEVGKDLKRFSGKFKAVWRHWSPNWGAKRDQTQSHWFLSMYPTIFYWFPTKEKRCRSLQKFQKGYFSYPFFTAYTTKMRQLWKRNGIYNGTNHLVSVTNADFLFLLIGLNYIYGTSQYTPFHSKWHQSDILTQSMV